MAIDPIVIDSNSIWEDLVDKLNETITVVNGTGSFDGADITNGSFDDGTIGNTSITGGSISGSSITGATIENSTIGLTTPAAGKFASIIITSPLSVDSGGTGGNTPETARTGLGLGAVATENVVPVTKGGLGTTSIPNARTALGLGALALLSTAPVANGGTGATDAAGARTNLGVPAIAHTHVIADVSGLQTALDTLTNGKFSNTGGTISGQVISNTGSTSSVMNSTTGQGQFMAQISGAGNAAMIAFHRASIFAAYFGIDTDNQLKFGGWSLGSNKYKIYHEGTVLKGSAAPSSGTGQNGDLFLVYES
jgi:hypothetical protein